MRKCDKCNNEGHYTHTDILGYWHYACDEHDDRPVFKLEKENKKLKAAWVDFQGEAEREIRALRNANLTEHGKGQLAIFERIYRQACAALESDK